MIQNQEGLNGKECIICHKGGFRKVGRPRLNKNFPHKHVSDYRILQCVNCGYYFVDPKLTLTQDEWTALYESNYFESSQKTQWQIELNHKELRERIGIIEQNLGETGKGKFLDMGCGEGFMLQKARANGFEPFGLDIADNINPTCKEGINFCKGSIFDARFPDDYFSVIYMDSVLEHVPDPVATLTELKRILKPGGIMLIIVPNEDSLMNSIAKFIYYVTLHPKKYGKIKPLVTPYHIQGFNKRSLQTLFTGLNLKLLSIKGFGGNYKFWKAHKTFSKQYFIHLLTYPFGLYSVLSDKQIQLMSVIQKQPCSS